MNKNKAPINPAISPYRRDINLPILGITHVTFTKSSLNVIELYNEFKEFERQKEQKQLGIIANAFGNISHTRYDYLMFQAKLSELFRDLDTYKGIEHFTQGTITIKTGESLCGDALLKSWFLLSNFGHTKDTYGDEKSLLIHCRKQKQFKAKLLDTIIDEELKTWAKGIIDKFDIRAFHHIISIYRIYQSKINIEKKQIILDHYKLLLINPYLKKNGINHRKLRQLNKHYEVIRALSIITLDGHYSHLPIKLDLLPMLLSRHTHENILKEETLSEYLNRVLNILHDDLYLNKKSVAIQRSYEIKANKYLHNNNGLQAIDRAISEGLFTSIIDKSEMKDLYITKKCYSRGKRTQCDNSYKK